jgi:hypothetical protein
MNSTRRHLPILAIGLAVLLTSTLTAQTNQGSWPGTLAMLNPCDGSIIWSANGTNVAGLHQNADDHGTHVFLRLRFEGAGLDNSATPVLYRVKLVARGRDIDPGQSSYDVNYHSLWVPEGKNTAFTMNGILRIFVADGTPFASQVLTYKTACRNDSDDLNEDRDHDRGHD